MRRALIILTFSALAAVSAFGAQLSDTYVVPAAAHATGAGGESWQTDVSIFNPGSTPLTVDVQLIPSSGAAATIVSSAVTVAAKSTTTLHDVLAPAGGSTSSVSGALIISGSQPFALGARAVAVTSAGSAAEAITPAVDFIDATSRDSFIAGLTSNASFRSNIGFFAAAGRGTPMRVTVTLLGADGTSLGTRNFDIPAGGTSQVQLSTHDLSSSTFDGGAAIVSITRGDGILTSYGSVVDNRTSVGMFISGAGGVLPPTAASSLLRSLWQ